MAKSGRQFYYGLGRRKESTARARLQRGKGEVTVNNKPAAAYFGHASLLAEITKPLELVGKADKLDISLKTSGGGKRGQADAARLAVAKAVEALDKELRTTLKKAGYLKRDARVKERKKYGLKRARKAPQFTKR